jgi:hypothetical protein
MIGHAPGQADMLILAIVNDIIEPNYILTVKPRL